MGVYNGTLTLYKFPVIFIKDKTTGGILTKFGTVTLLCMSVITTKFQLNPSIYFSNLHY